MERKIIGHEKLEHKTIKSKFKQGIWIKRCRLEICAYINDRLSTEMHTHLYIVREWKYVHVNDTHCGIIAEEMASGFYAATSSPAVFLGSKYFEFSIAVGEKMLFCGGHLNLSLPGTYSFFGGGRVFTSTSKSAATWEFDHTPAGHMTALLERENKE